MVHGPQSSSLARYFVRVALQEGQSASGFEQVGTAVISHPVPADSVGSALPVWMNSTAHSILPSDMSWVRQTPSFSALVIEQPIVYEASLR